MPQFFETAENRVYTLLSFLSAFVVLFFIAPESNLLTLIQLPVSGNKPFYAALAMLFVLSVGAIAFFSQRLDWKKQLGTLLFIWLPAAALLAYGLFLSSHFHYAFRLGVGLYVIVAGIVLSGQYIERQWGLRERASEDTSLLGWCRKQGLAALVLVVVLTGIFFGAGLHRLSEFAAVDEPLWLYGRIDKYWNNILDREWKKTNVSDKPGITVSILAGPGLLTHDPDNYEDRDIQYVNEAESKATGIQSFYFAFRFPLLLSITVFLPFFYFLLERLLGRGRALFGFAMIATAPLLVGISKIINPDSLLWVFAPLSLLSYLAFLKRRSYRYLFLGGIFLGLALLTKYVANILIVFYLGLIFLDYLYHPRERSVPFPEYLKRSLIDLLILVFIALSVFYVFLPAAWVKPGELLSSTIFSQAFQKVAPLFIALIGAILVDQWLNRSRVTGALLEFLSRGRRFIGMAVAMLFLGSMLFMLADIWAGMRPYDFMDLLASPKSILSRGDFVSIFLTNFYPLVFGVTPWVLLGMLVGPIFFFRKDFARSNGLRTAFYLVVFILLYYLGSTVNGVASIIRYQIMLYPAAAVIAAVAFGEVLRLARSRFGRNFWLGSLPLAIAFTFLGTFVLLRTPFPLSYASSLLPKEDYIDLKDMGPGSYEVAQWLDTLPGAQDMMIWTDKDGVCRFFVGRCRRGTVPETIHETGYDFIVVSSAREHRTTGMLTSKAALDATVVPFFKYYGQDGAAYTLNVNGRSSHFVKAFAFTKTASLEEAIPDIKAIDQQQEDQ